LILVARGLELLLKKPSEITQQWLKEHLEAWFEAGQAPYTLPSKESKRFGGGISGIRRSFA
jgi:hypothetical protein